MMRSEKHVLLDTSLRHVTGILRTRTARQEKTKGKTHVILLGPAREPSSINAGS